MKLEIYDFDLYEKDNAAKSVQSEIEPLVNSVEGLWRYREPELRTEGNELPTFTLLSEKYGLIFVKVFEYQDCGGNTVVILKKQMELEECPFM